MTVHQRLGSDAAEVYVRALGDNVAQWDVSVWDGTDVWTAPGWATVTCQVRGLTWVDGADRVEGVMSSAAGGSWTLELYDPDREMDPTNPYGYLGRWVQPGQYIKVGFTGGDIGIGIIDELQYEPRTTIARLRGTDPVGLMATVEVDRPPVGVNTLRALARWVLNEMGAEYLTVEDDPPAGDEPIGAPDDAEATPSDKFRAWELITTAAQDVLNFAWVDRELVVRFRAHDDATDPSIDLGCTGIPLLGVAVASTGADIVNDVAAKDLAGGGTVTAEDAASKRRYGTRSIDRTTRKVPDAQAWADAVVEDRAWSSLEWLPLQAWPTAADGLAQLEGIWGADMMRRVRIRGDVTDPDIFADGRLLGRRVEVSPDGWNVSVLAYINNDEWATTPLPPPSPPDPMPPYQLVDRVVEVDQVARLVYDGITAEGVGLEAASLVGTLGSTPASFGPIAATSARNRLVMGWTVPPDWTDVLLLERAVLRLWTPPGLGDVWDDRAQLAYYRYTSPAVPGGSPLPGEIEQPQSDLARIRVNHTDADGRDRSAFLTGLGNGDTFEHTDSGTVWTIVAANHLSSWTDYTVTPINAEPPVAVGAEPFAFRQAAWAGADWDEGLWTGPLPAATQPRIRVRALRDPFTEGVEAIPSPDNAVIWPGPLSTAFAEQLVGVPQGGSLPIDLDVTEVVNQWAPVIAGGNGQDPDGFGIWSADDTDPLVAAALATDDAPEANRPTLTLTVRVPL